MMNTVVRSDLKANTFSISNSYTQLKEKEICFVSFKFYQQLLVLLFSFLTILIFPESPKELGSICENHNSKEICNIW